MRRRCISMFLAIVIVLAPTDLSMVMASQPEQNFLTASENEQVQETEEESVFRTEYYMDSIPNTEECTEANTEDENTEDENAEYAGSSETEPQQTTTGQTVEAVAETETEETVELLEAAGDYEYVLNDKDEAVITKYIGHAADLVIPEKLGEHTVTAIEKSAFCRNSYITNVWMPDSILTIGDRAFEECHLLSGVKLSKNVKNIGFYAFYDCDKITDIEIPKSLEYTKGDSYSAFRGIFSHCDGLKNITFEDGVTQIPANIFAYCTGIEEVEIPDTVTRINYSSFLGCSNLKRVQIGTSVTTIEDQAFKECSSLSRIEFPDAVTEIGNKAFEGCSVLSEVILPKKVEVIGYDAFTDCGALADIRIPKSLHTTKKGDIEGLRGIFGHCDALKTVDFEEGMTKLPANIFAHCTGIEEIVIPDTMTIIEDYAFWDCANLKDIQIGASITQIGKNAFKGCVSLTNIEIPDSVTELGEGAFENCSRLSSVKLSKGLTTICRYAFKNCKLLEAIEIPKSLENIKRENSWVIDGIFNDCESLKTVTFEEGRTRIPKDLFAYCTGIEELVLPDTVSVIDEYAFYRCTNLKQIKLPTGATEIGKGAFQGACALTGIELPDSVERIGTDVFYDCTSIAAVKLSDHIQEIPSKTFYNCTSLLSIEIPDQVTIIQNAAFEGSGLTELTVPENVTKIADSAFAQCMSLGKITFSQALQEIEQNAFKNNDALTELVIPEGVVSIGRNAFQDCDLLERVLLSDSVEILGEYAFENCDKLKEVKLGTGLTEIAAYTFHLCPALEQIALPYRVNAVRNNAFTNCTGLTEIIIPRSVESIDATVFSYPSRLTVYGIAGTYAQTYAAQIGAAFVNREVKASEVKLNISSLTMNKGDTYTLVMHVTPEDFTDAVDWKTPADSVVSVSQSGVVKADAIGKTSVQVVVGDVKASCEITVVQPVTDIRLNTNELSLEAFDEATLTATVLPEDAFDKSVEWITSDETVAAVTQEGNVVAVSKGSTVVKAAAKDGSGRAADCNVTVKSDGQLCTAYSELESRHDYENNTNKIWKYVQAGAASLEITFDERTCVDDGYDFIYIYDKENNEIQKATGTALAGQTIQVPGDTVKIRLVSDQSGTDWGFKVVKLTAGQNGTEPDETESSSEEENSSEENSSEENSSEKNSSEEESSSAEESSTVEESSSEEESSSAEESSPIDDEGEWHYPQESISWTPFLQVHAEISGKIKSKVYDGLAYTPTVKVTITNPNGKKTTLTEGTDYRVSYKNNVHAGTGQIVVKGNGIYEGQLTKEFTIEKKPVKKLKVLVGGVAAGVDSELPVYVYDGSKLLIKDKDYTIDGIRKELLTQKGKYGFTVTAAKDSDYQGSVNAKITVYETGGKNVKGVINPENVQLTSTSMPYTGKALKPAVTVRAGEDILDSRSYTVKYINNKNAGMAFAVVTGKRGYAGTVVKNFEITAVDTKSGTFELKRVIKPVTYNGKLQKPKPVITFGGKTLKAGRDYTITYSNNLHVTDHAGIIIKGMGNYASAQTKRIDFQIKPQQIKKVTVKGTQGKLDISYAKHVLVEGSDYTLEYGAEVSKGRKITVKIKGKGNFTGEVNKIVKK